MTDDLTALRAERDRLVALADVTPERTAAFARLRAEIADVCDRIAVHLYGPEAVDADRRRLANAA